MANYLTAVFWSPLLVFRASERETYEAAHRSRFALRCFMADKMRECTYGYKGELLLRTKDCGAADRSAYPGGTIIAEMHALVAAVRRWRSAMD